MRLDEEEGNQTGTERSGGCARTRAEAVRRRPKENNPGTTVKTEKSAVLHGHYRRKIEEQEESGGPSIIDGTNQSLKSLQGLSLLPSCRHWRH
jgi:hypothetical protein